MAIPVITAYWSENADDVPSVYAGWKIEVCVNKMLLDLSRFGFDWKGTAPFTNQENSTEGSKALVGLGPNAWVMTPDKNPLFRKENGAQREKPPMVEITQCAGLLAGLGFIPTACNSVVFGNGFNAHIIWFFKLQ